MTVSLRGPVAALKAILVAMNVFAVVQIGVPPTVPVNLTAAILLRKYKMEGTNLAGTEENRAVVIRVYQVQDEAAEENELALDDMVSAIYTAIAGDYDLGGVIRAVKIVEITSDFGFAEIEGSLYRVVDITVPMLVDDSATFIK